MANALDPITIGKDFNYFANVNVTVSTFNALADVAIRFRGQQHLHFTLVSGGPVEYSFNGNTVHGDMTLSTSTADLDFGIRPGKKIWFRLGGGGAAAVVRVEAWQTCES